jgi:hypothetical protein
MSNNNHTNAGGTWRLSSSAFLFAFVTVLLQLFISTSQAFSIKSVNSVNSVKKSVQVLKVPCHTQPKAQLYAATRENKLIFHQLTPHHQSHSTTLFNSNTFTQNEDQEKEDRDVSTPLPSYGGLLGKITGLSMTAIRKSIRTTTGLSLTATRTALRGLTGVSVTGTMKMLFGIFPPWVSTVQYYM